MKTFEILPHTGDVRVKAAGSTLAELFTAALEGMFDVAKPHFDVKAPTVERPFKIESADSSALLVDFLNEAIALSDANGEVYSSVRFDQVSDTTVVGSFLGKTVEGFDTQIKAATYHDLKLERNQDGEMEATVIFDV